MVCLIRTFFPGTGQHDFKLSLCGAAAISQDAVSALLRLPLLSGLQLDGCHRISSIDKMRLIAKVTAMHAIQSPSSTLNIGGSGGVVLTAAVVALISCGGGIGTDYDVFTVVVVMVWRSATSLKARMIEPEFKQVQ
jgi:hypothetical protein